MVVVVHTYATFFQLYGSIKKYFSSFLYHVKNSRAGQYIIHLMCAPEGNSEFCFPESLNVSRDEVEGNIETREEHTLSALLYSKKRKIKNTYTIIVFHDIMTINRK